MGDTEKDLMTLQYCDVISCLWYVNTDHNKDCEKIVKEIAKTNDLIRKKYLALKTVKMEEDTLERRFKPIIDSLKQIVENTVESSKDPIMTENILLGRRQGKIQKKTTECFVR